MKVTFKIEETGKNDLFDSNDNLLITAIEREGYTDVYTSGSQWFATKTCFFGLIKKKVYGRITAKANGLIKMLSQCASGIDTVIDLSKE